MSIAELLAGRVTKKTQAESTRSGAFSYPFAADYVLV